MLCRGETESATKPGLLGATRSKKASALSGSPRNNARRPERNSLSIVKLAQAATNKSVIVQRESFMEDPKISAGRRKDKFTIDCSQSVGVFSVWIRRRARQIFNCLCLSQLSVNERMSFL